MSRKTRKLIWSAPLVAVFAVVGALAIFVALAPNQAQADHVELPGIVTGVMAEADGRDTIDLTWKAPADGGAVDYYRIDRSLPDDNDNWMRLVQMHTEGTSYTDMTDLKANKTYDYRVFAVNAAGTGPSSDLTEKSAATTADTSRPGPVRMLTGKVMGPTQINLSWYPPESNGGAGITRYCISTAADGHTDGLVVPGADGALAGCTHNTPPTTDASEQFNSGNTDSGDTTGRGVIVILAPEGDGKVEFMHEKLPASGSQEYEVYAANSKGISTSAAAVEPTPQTGTAGKPGAPILRAAAATDRTVSLYWTWPADNGGADIANFDVDTKVGAADWDSLDGTFAVSGNENVVPTQGATVQLAVATPLDATTSYRVRANNGVMDSAWSNVVTIRITGTSAGGDLALATESPVAVTGLPQVIPSAQLLRQINLTWNDVQNTSYLIDYRKSGNTSNWMSLQGNTGYSKSTYNHRNLKPDDDDTSPAAVNPAPADADYIYRVFPLKSGIYGPAALGYGSTAMAEKPAAVTGLKTSSDDPTKIKLEWNKPTVDGGETITGYRIEIGLDNTWPNGTSATDITPAEDDCPTLDDTTVCVREVEGADTTMYTLGKLKAGNVRWFRVFAINKVSRADVVSGDADASFPDATDARRAQPKKGTSLKHGTPGVPLDLTVQPARDANEDDPAKLGIDLLWNLPDAASGDSVTGYIIARRTKDSTDADWSAWDDDWATITGEGSNFERTYFTDTDEPDNIANGEMREYRVRAKSGTGTGPWTDVVVYPVDTSHAAPPPLTSPMLTAVAGTDAGTVDLSWDRAGAAAYVVWGARPDASPVRSGSTDQFIQTATTEMSMTVTGLMSGQEYWFVIQACENAACTEPAVPMYSAVVPVRAR